MNSTQNKTHLTPTLTDYTDTELEHACYLLPRHCYLTQAAA